MNSLPRHPKKNPLKPFEMFEVGDTVRLVQKQYFEKAYKDRFNIWHPAEIVLASVSITITRHEAVSPGYDEYQYIEIGEDNKGFEWRRTEPTINDGPNTSHGFYCKMMRTHMDVRIKKGWLSRPILDMNELTEEERSQLGKENIL